jgi:hypothetical protein
MLSDSLRVAAACAELPCPELFCEVACAELGCDVGCEVPECTVFAASAIGAPEAQEKPLPEV